MASSRLFDGLVNQLHAGTNEHACDWTERTFKRKPCRVRHPRDVRA